MTVLRAGRRARILCLRGLRLVRRHHSSLFSAVIIAILLVIALTSSKFEVAGNPSAQPAVAALNQSPASGGIDNVSGHVRTRTVVYYIVSSEDDIRVLNSARRSDAAYALQQGLPPMPDTLVYYLIFESPEEEAAGARLLNQLVDTAPGEGFSLKIVDLTR